MRKERTGFTPGTLPLITFDRCAFETRRYKAACASVMTEVVEFGRIMIFTRMSGRNGWCLVSPVGDVRGRSHGLCWEQR